MVIGLFLTWIFASRTMKFLNHTFICLFIQILYKQRSNILCIKCKYDSLTIAVNTKNSTDNGNNK